LTDRRGIELVENAYRKARESPTRLGSIALWSYVRSINRAKGRKIIGTSATDRDADP